MVRIGGATFLVEIAGTPAERTRGLSGRDGMAPGTGMLFVRETGLAGNIWMKDMRFPLDLIWISEECAVADISHDVAAPTAGTPDSQLRSYSSSEPAVYTLEVNAREAERLGIAIGAPVRFTGVPGDRASACQQQ